MTKSSTSWAVQNVAYEANMTETVGGTAVELFATTGRDFLIEPAFPYIYIPIVDFDDIIARIPADANAVIDPAKRFIKWDEKCSDFKTSMAQKDIVLNFTFALSTNGNI